MTAIGVEPRTALGRIRHALPEGRTLPGDVWQRRHRALLTLLWAHAAGLAVFAITRGYSVGHSLQEGSLVAAIAVAATLAGSRKRIAAALVSFGLISSSALLVHLWDGAIEGHFHFFVMIVVLSLYEDWVPFLLAAAYVVIHHGLAGAIDPGSVYNHSAAIAHPWRWAAIHGFFVTGAGVGSVVAWRLNENVRLETVKAYSQARDSEERFRSAFENAPIGMVLSSLESPGRFIQVNRAMSEITGYSQEELVGKSLREITHPDDVGENEALFTRLLTGELSDFEVEKRYLRPDGREVWGRANVSLVHGSSGEPLYAIGQVQDITERRRAKEQLVYQAYHDPLTGLPNRRKLMEDLAGRLASATRADPMVLVLYDLDGFKSYNDTFGHPAGDALLSILGKRLAAAVKDRGDCYRMGGDEFCVMGPIGAEGPEALATTAAAGLSEKGEGFTVSASYGSVILPVEAQEEAEALRKADQRMYARKGKGRASAGRQATDALLRALSERNADLGTHLNDVTDLCEAVARKLSVPEEQLTSLLQAATLHDVGKVAIPDQILNKPGPLDESEWAFIRTHTVIGERILAAAPALSQAAKIVRFSHERYDGEGYPDGIGGEDIPLGSRIVAACDAFDAMISDRPYRSAMSVEGALSELRRCSGTQFDPDVVEAIVGAIAEAPKVRPASAI